MARYDGTDGNDVWDGTSGDDVAYGYAGQDRLSGGSGNDELHGGDGNDTLSGANGADWLDGGAGDDYLSLYAAGASRGDRMSGGDGYDTLGLVGGIGVTVDVTKVIIDGDIENLSVFGSLRILAEQISALDARIGGTFISVADGGLIDARGSYLDSTLMLSNAGNQVVLTGVGGTSIIGGAADDAITDRRLHDDSLASARLDGGAGDDHILILTGNLSGVDRSGEQRGLFGGAGDDRLVGGVGADALYGESDRDRLAGGDGDDILTGGTGLDLMRGDAGADRFVFAAMDSSANRAGADRIFDFSGASGDGDRIDLSAAGATSFIGDHAFGGVAGEVRFEVLRHATLVAVDADGDGRADLTVLMDGAPTLTASDFIVG